MEIAVRTNLSSCVVKLPLDTGRFLPLLDPTPVRFRVPPETKGWGGFELPVVSGRPSTQLARDPDRRGPGRRSPRVGVDASPAPRVATPVSALYELGRSEGITGLRRRAPASPSATASTTRSTRNGGVGGSYRTGSVTVPIPRSLATRRVNRDRFLVPLFIWFECINWTAVRRPPRRIASCRRLRGGYTGSGRRFPLETQG